MGAVVSAVLVPFQVLPAPAEAAPTWSVSHDIQAVPVLRMSATVPQQQQQNKNLPQEEKKKTSWVSRAVLPNLYEPIVCWDTRWPP